MNQPKKNFRAGFVTIIGRPNVGKSTLLNHLVGEKLAGVSPKPQTTRVGIRGIMTREQGQIVFLDTPGIHNPKDKLGSWMVGEAEKGLPDADLIYWIVLPEPPHSEEKKILELVKEVKVPVILIVNQTDRFPKPEILPVLDHYAKTYPFRELIPISAKTGDQVDLLISKTFENLPLGEAFFPDDQISDQNERFIVREIIAEKLFHYTGDEIPYSTAVMIDDFTEGDLVRIEATIFVEKDSQKAIIIGAGGQKLKQIGQAARMDIEKLLGQKVFLRLWVKALPHWKRDQSALRRLGYQ